ncbi:MAG TPA: phosphoglucosamine mutase [Actinomycetota bacterium]|nr:phosphoglucosamine mutase [Actinomycetota bacterium]
MARLFGTDGVRGVAGTELTADLAFALGWAAAEVLGGGGPPTFVVGRDTRASGAWLEEALVRGILAAGGSAILAGVVPTPAVSFLVPSLGATAGAVVSASHNPPEYNGIKFLGGTGGKLPDELEERIEELVLAGSPERAGGGGEVRPLGDALERYLDHLVRAAERRLDGLRVVLDAANGAAHRLGPEVLRRLGADVVPIFDRPDGSNINVGCGALHPEVVARAVVAHGADAGVSFDGDADRALFADAAGNVIDGDQVLAACALALREQGRLPGDRVVATVMSNLGFRRAMEEAGIEVVETPVGDRHVREAMDRTGAALGGEQSGHIIFAEHAVTGDGLLTAVRFLSLAVRRGLKVGELGAVMHRYPQVLENVPARDPGALERSGGVRDAIRAAERALGASGRVLVRASGTEPLVRVMVEAASEDVARRHARAIAEVVRAELG